jgi:hypothetical protein
VVSKTTSVLGAHIELGEEGDEEIASVALEGFTYFVVPVPDEALVSDIEPYDIIELPSRTAYLIAISQEYLACLQDEIEREEAYLCQDFGLGIAIGLAISVAAQKVEEGKHG